MKCLAGKNYLEELSSQQQQYKIKKEETPPMLELFGMTSKRVHNFTLKNMFPFLFWPINTNDIKSNGNSS